ncbi:unnamed protein product [Durusdinium trenchii]|uniref:Uncharacterized protein n=1 Tax=Durusdinium trenchii TaxID=1381693 RepID=A0ABP0MFJ9_9DINO
MLRGVCSGRGQLCRVMSGRNRRRATTVETMTVEELRGVLSSWAQEVNKTTRSEHADPNWRLPEEMLGQVVLRLSAVSLSPLQKRSISRDCLDLRLKFPEPLLDAVLMDRGLEGPEVLMACCGLQHRRHEILEHLRQLQVEQLPGQQLLKMVKHVAPEVPLQRRRFHAQLLHQAFYAATATKPAQWPRRCESLRNGLGGLGGLPRYLLYLTWCGSFRFLQGLPTALLLQLNERLAWSEPARRASGLRSLADLTEKETSSTLEKDVLRVLQGCFPWTSCCQVSDFRVLHPPRDMTKSVVSRLPSWPGAAKEQRPEIDSKADGPSCTMYSSAARRVWDSLSVGMVQCV